jgi:8-oxo-dGTP diphosphatase
LNTFNIRVYGILINDKKSVLITDEIVHGKEITKFPGGGLEFGEGTLDCIKREFIEETGQAIEVIKHFYTTDFFQESAFNKASQVVSIYYLVKFLDIPKIRISSAKFDFEKKIEGAQIFRWVNLSEISPDDFTFPIDKKIAVMLRDLNSDII